MSGTTSDPLNSGLVFSCSPRQGGNSDTAAALFARTFSVSSGKEVQPLFLRDFQVLPCIACDACGRLARRLAADQNREREARPRAMTVASLSGQGMLPAFGCALAAKDDSAQLLHSLAVAPNICLVSPVYFYHLPAMLKSLIDRTQPFWSFREAGLFFAGAERTCHVILIGARPKGDQLFTGSLLTLKYALSGLNVRLADPLLLYGLEAPSALASNSEAVEKVRAYAAAAAKGFAVPHAGRGNSNEGKSAPPETER